MTDLSTYMATELAKKMGEEKDNIIRACIRNRVGPEVRIKDVITTGRLRADVSDDSKSELWSLDGQPLVQIWPPETKVDDGRMTVSISYKIPNPTPEEKARIEQMRKEGI